MELREIIGRIAEEGLVEKIAFNFKGEQEENLKDLCQYIYLELLTKEEGLIESMYADGSLRFYITKMVLNQINSKTSPYHKTYRIFDDDKHKEDNGGL